MSGDEVESGHAVVQNYSSPIHDNAAAKALMHALNERGPVAEFIRRCDVCRATPVIRLCNCSVGRNFPRKSHEEFTNFLLLMLIGVGDPELASAPRFLLCPDQQRHVFAGIMAKFC